MNTGAVVLAQGLQELSAFATSLENEKGDIITGAQVQESLIILTGILGATLTMLAMALAGDLEAVDLSDLDNLPETGERA